MINLQSLYAQDANFEQFFIFKLYQNENLSEFVCSSFLKFIHYSVIIPIILSHFKKQDNHGLTCLPT
jgi:hypothetical protein